MFNTAGITCAGQNTLVSSEFCFVLYNAWSRFSGNILSQPYINPGAHKISGSVYARSIRFSCKSGMNLEWFIQLSTCIIFKDTHRKYAYNIQSHQSLQYICHKQTRLSRVTNNNNDYQAWLPMCRRILHNSNIMLNHHICSGHQQ